MLERKQGELLESYGETYANQQPSPTSNGRKGSETRTRSPERGSIMSVGYPSGNRSALPLSNKGDDIVRYSCENRRLTHQYNGVYIGVCYNKCILLTEDIDMLLTKRAKDLTGQTFGSLTAIRPSHKGENNTLYWVFQCACGKEHIARGNIVQHQVKRGVPGSPSCGCVELANKTRHGFRKAKDTHPAYKAYRGLMGRCYNPSVPEYQWYGAVGVTVCPEWKDNPKAFVEWSLSNGWKKGLHIDKDILCKEKGIYLHVYSPETCQWVSAKVNVAFATNRDNYGKHPNVRLSNETVAEIEAKYFSGEETNQSALAREYGLLSPSSIGRIIRLAKGKASSNALANI
jgi:hypothetical protein